MPLASRCQHAIIAGTLYSATGFMLAVYRPANHYQAPGLLSASNALGPVSMIRAWRNNIYTMKRDVEFYEHWRFSIQQYIAKHLLTAREETWHGEEGYETIRQSRIRAAAVTYASYVVVIMHLFREDGAYIASSRATPMPLLSHRSGLFRLIAGRDRLRRW